MTVWIRTIFIICLFAGFVHGLSGRAFAEEPPKKVPVTVNADKLDYDRVNDVYIAEGHVKVEQDGMHVEADKVVLNNKTGEASAEGKVYLQEKGQSIRADSVKININTKAGLIYNGDLFMTKDNLHIKGDKIERKSESEYHVEKAIFTTCDEGEWYLKADELDVDMNRYATGSHVSFNMIGLPVLYTPYLLFPVRRQTGLLLPEYVGYSSREGFQMINAFFWAISDYQDMTLYSDYRARHGLGTGIEYRYVNSRDSGGKLFYNYFNTFNEYRVVDTPDTRWLLSYQHHQEIAEDLSVRADINVVSDFAYFRDLEKKLEPRSQPYLDSNLFYIERWDTASLNLLGQYSIDLTKKDNDTTIQKLPELRYNIFEEQVVGPLHVNFQGSATNFTRQSGDDVMRADFNPRISAPLGSGGLTLTPRIGARATYYDISATSTEPAQRKFYYAAADLNARVSRVYGSDAETGIGRIRHSIEPTISYSYIPTVDQTNLPQLDAVDTIAAQNLVTASIINRLTAHYKDSSGSRSFDLLFFRLSESYDLNKARSDNTSEQARSLVLAEIVVNTPKVLTFSASENFDTYIHEITSSTESMNVKTDTFRFNVSHQYLRTPVTRYLIGGAGTKIGKWDIYGQIWRDIVQEKITQQEYKLHYASQCWGLAVDFIKKPGETQYLLTLDLKGLGALKF